MNGQPFYLYEAILLKTKICKSAVFVIVVVERGKELKEFNTFKKNFQKRFI